MIRLGIAGLGRWGRTLVDSVQQPESPLRFVAAAAGRPERARDYAAFRGLRLEPDLQVLLARDDLDGVVLATPHSQHAEQMRQAFEAGKHVLVEKPMVLHRSEAEAAAAQARAAGRQLCVAFNRRFLPATRALLDLLKSGQIGTLLAAEANFSHSGGYRYSPESWRADPSESPAGGMTGLGVHLVDALIDLAGPVARVATRSKRQVLQVPLDDSTMVAIDFTSGALGNLVTVQASAELWSLRLIGSAGWVEMRGYDRLVVCGRDGIQRQTRFPPFDMQRAELEAFAAVIRDEADWPVTVDQAVHGVAVLEAIVESARSRTAIDLT